MPWDITTLAVASLTDEGYFSAVTQVQGLCPASILQPRFNGDRQLYVISDWSGWWNIYRYDLSFFTDGAEPVNVCPLRAEACSAQWQLGKYNYDFGVDGSIAVSICSEGHWSLLHISAEAEQATHQGDRSYETILDGFGVLILESSSVVKNFTGQLFSFEIFIIPCSSFFKSTLARPAIDNGDRLLAFKKFSNESSINSLLVFLSHPMPIHK